MLRPVLLTLLLVSAGAAQAQSSMAVRTAPVGSVDSPAADSLRRDSPLSCRSRCSPSRSGEVCIPEVSNVGSSTIAAGTGVALTIDGRSYGAPAFTLPHALAPGETHRLPSPVPRIRRCEARPM